VIDRITPFLTSDWAKFHRISTRFWQWFARITYESQPFPGINYQREVIDQISTLISSELWIKGGIFDQILTSNFIEQSIEYILSGFWRGFKLGSRRKIRPDFNVKIGSKSGWWIWWTKFCGQFIAKIGRNRVDIREHFDHASMLKSGNFDRGFLVKIFANLVDPVYKVPVSKVSFLVRVDWNSIPIMTTEISSSTF